MQSSQLFSMNERKRHHRAKVVKNLYLQHEEQKKSRTKAQKPAFAAIRSEEKHPLVISEQRYEENML
jgi:hypothetical protein